MATTMRARRSGATDEDVSWERAQEAHARLEELLGEAAEGVADAEAVLHEAGMPQPSADLDSGERVDFEAASVRLFMQKQLQVMRANLSERATCVAHARLAVQSQSRQYGR